MEHGAPMREFLGLTFNLANVLDDHSCKFDCVHFRCSIHTDTRNETNRDAKFYGVGHGFC